MRQALLHAVFAAILLLLLCSAGCSAPQPAAPQQTAGGSGIPPATLGQVPAPFSLTVGSVAPGGELPAAYTCTGAFASPPVSWENVPAGTETLTLIMEDPDAPSGTFTHWIVYNIPPERRSIPGALTAVKEIDGGGQQGTNSAGGRGYTAACPPIGPAHRYVFTLYAVDYTMGLPTANRDGIGAMLDGHWIEKAVVTATFGR